NRPVTRAWIEYLPDNRITGIVAGLGTLGARNTTSVLSLSTAGRAVWDDVPLKLDAERRTFSAVFQPHVSGMYALHLEDANGLRPQRRLLERPTTPAPAPALTVEPPAPQHVLVEMLPGAASPMHLPAEDNTFATRSVFIESRTQRNEPLRRLSLYNHQTAGLA